MASSAAISSFTGTGVTAPGAKIQTQDGAAGAFADLLAAIDAAGLAQPAPGAAPDALPVEDAGDDTDIETAPQAAPFPPAAMPQAAKPQAQAPAGEEAAKSEERKPGDAANDNSAAMAMLQIPAAAPQPAASATPQPTGAAAGVAASSPQQAQPHDAASGEDDAAENTAALAAAPQAGEAAPKQGAAKPTKAAADFRKALDNAKPATAKADAAASQTGASTDTAGETKSAGAGQPQQADARAPAPPHAALHGDAQQPDALVPAAATSNAAPANAATASTRLPDATPPAPHPAPNLHGLAVDITARSQSGAKQFDIRLDPPELGRVEVRLSIDAAGKAEAHLTADQPQTLDLLQKDAPSLTRALREAGLDVSQDGLNFSLRQQQQDARQDQAMPQARQARAGFAAQAAVETIITPRATQARGLLDIRV